MEKQIHNSKQAVSQECQVAYLRGKLHYKSKEYGKAKVAFLRVTERKDYQSQDSSYFLKSLLLQALMAAKTSQCLLEVDSLLNRSDVLT